MKSLSLPDVDDDACTTATANNKSLKKTSYPLLAIALPAILKGYKHYEMNCGNALNVEPLGIGQSLKDGLLKNYKKPPGTLLHINQIRQSSPVVCPMCGSLKTTSLDHVLPKEHYPEFAIYSKNLVPACDCNSKRGTATRHSLSGARILHPYFDSLLLKRQLSCVIIPRPAFPKAEIKINYVNPAEPLIESLKFHVQKVVLPSGLIGWLDSRWDSLDKYPGGVIHTLPHRRLNSEYELKLCLEDALNRYDRSLDTPNNWESIFVHGLLHSSGVVPWLLGQHNQNFP